MDQLEKQMIDIVNRNHARRKIMDRVRRNAAFEKWADKFAKISDRRKKC